MKHMTQPLSRCLWTLAMTTLLAVSSPVRAEDSEQPAAPDDAAARGLAIAEEADRRHSGFGDSRARLVMQLGTAGGDVVEREMRQRVLEVESDGDKTLMSFDRPRDLKNTALLTHTHKVGPDDQWLYLPALKRVKRISSSDQSGAFMGSEFAYEDLGSQEVEKYRYEYLGEEICEDNTCFVVARYPLDDKSGYTRQVMRVDQSEYLTRRIDYYDRKDELLKSMAMRDYVHYEGRYWRPTIMYMYNHQTGKSTTLRFDDYRFQVGESDNDFMPDALTRNP